MEKIGKRIFDIFFSFLGLIFISPLFLLVAILIKLDSSGPIFFKQKRVGRNGKIFKIYKFRTMVKNAQEKGVNFTTPNNDSRITKIGRILRKSNIDEFPQLINVLVGEMSLVGPRAEIPKIVDLYTDKQKNRFTRILTVSAIASLEFRKEGKILSSIKDL